MTAISIRTLTFANGLSTRRQVHLRYNLSLLRNPFLLQPFNLISILLFFQKVSVFQPPLLGLPLLLAVSPSVNREL